MNILIAPDSFKGSLNATGVCEAIAEGIRKRHVDAILERLPFSDGGEGAFELFSTLNLGTLTQCETCDPLHRPLRAPYFAFNDGTTAWIELSQASGLSLLTANEATPLKTSTYGTGLQLKHAIHQGFKNIIMGVGGSATNDMALGIFAALGGRILDEKEKPIPPNGAALLNCTRLVLNELDPQLKKTSITIACDVTNTLLGPNGAAQTYAAQKGAAKEDIERLEKGATQMAGLIEQITGRGITHIRGGGAAGGTAAGMYGLFGSPLRPGFKLLSSLTKLEEKVKAADLIITGEGQTDLQSKFGKVPFELAKLAKKYAKPLLLFAGSITATQKELKQHGITAAYAIKQPNMSLEYAVANAHHLIAASVYKHLNHHL